MIKVYNAADIAEAHIVKGMLEANEIDAHVSGHYLQGGIGELAATDFASVSVNDEDLEKAQQLIQQYEQQGGKIEHPPAAPQRPVNSSYQLVLIAVFILLLLITLWLIFTEI